MASGAALDGDSQDCRWPLSIGRPVDACPLPHPYSPDAVVLAEALASESQWLVTHDKRHFLTPKVLQVALALKVRTPGEVLAWVRQLLLPRRPLK